MPSELDAIRQEISELRAKVERKGKVRDKRRALQCRLNPDEIRLVDAAAVARGLTRADLIRFALNSVLGAEFRMHRDIPDGLRRFTVRHKPDHFSDQKTSVVERAHAMSREDAGRKAMMLNMEAKAILRARDAPQHTAGMIADSRIAPLSR